jgi:chitinase
LASIGGWSGSQFWSTNVASDDSRKKFVQTVTDFAKTYALDGVDFEWVISPFSCNAQYSHVGISWEYPVGGGETCNNYSPSDTINYLAFMTALRAANPDLIFTAAAGIKPWKDASGNPMTDVSGFAAAFDWVAIMNYDEFGQWSTTAGPNAALDDSCAPAAAQQGSATSAVAAWTAAGIPASQLVLGVASYGHAFNVTTASALPSGSSTDAGSSQLALFPSFSPWTYAAGEPVATECGAPAAKDVQYTFAGLIQAGLLTANGTAAAGIASTYDSCSQTPFVYDATNGTYVSFDDATSFAAKGKFIQSKGLRGFAMWEASGDYQNILLDSIRGAVGL